MAEGFGTPHGFLAPDGTELSARLAGPEDAPPLVLVHGFSMSAVAFSEQLGGPLAKRFRIITPDLRGHGLSDVGADLAALARPETYASDLKAAIDRFTTRPPIVGGWSFGGRVICAYLEAHSFAAGAVFIGSVTDDVLPDGKPPHGPGAAPLLDMCGEDDLVAAEATVRFVDGMFAVPVRPAVRDRILAVAAAVPRAVRREMRGLRSDNRALLETLAMPVLAIHGEEDRVIRPAGAQAIVDHAQDGTLVMMPGVGHATFLEAPGEFDAAITAFAVRCGLG